MNPRARLPHAQRSSDRVIAGVAGGWADRWGIEPTVLRASIGLLTLVGGIGLALYAVAAVLSIPASSPGVTRPPAKRVANHRRHLSVAAAAAAVLVACRAIGLWPGDGIMLPASAVAVGIAVVWTFGDRPRLRADWWSSRGVQIGVGLALLAAGVLSLARRTGGLASVGASASAIAVVVGGLVMFLAPAAGRLLRSLDDERAARIREDERATVAAHLHDSVLQSLVLIQRTDDPKRMSSLARRQERELRAWLYGNHLLGAPTTLHEAMEQLTAEIESDHDVRIELVVVGDEPLDAASRALVAAIREALVNAARHAKVDQVDVFVEAHERELTGFVHDMGCGFDSSSVPADRHGISDSIVGRVQRAGGTAVLVSQLGVGTEIELRVPRLATR